MNKRNNVVVGVNMSRRTERIGRLLQQEIGRILLDKLADPRINSACTSVTRVEVRDDLASAKVYVSIIGTEAEQSRGLKALQRAAGHVHALVRSSVNLRHTPALKFLADQQFKETLRTWNVIRQAMDEIDAGQDRQNQQGDSPEEN